MYLLGGCLPPNPQGADGKEDFGFKFYKSITSSPCDNGVSVATVQETPLRETNPRVPIKPT